MSRSEVEAYRTMLHRILWAPAAPFVPPGMKSAWLACSVYLVTGEVYYFEPALKLLPLRR